MEINRPLAIAHSMKEQLRSFWEFSSRKEGCRFLLIWSIEALESGVELLEKAARTLLNKAEGLLSYFDHRIDNGKAEGINMNQKFWDKDRLTQAGAKEILKGNTVFE